MKPVKVIFKRDFFSRLKSPRLLVILSLCALFWSVIFINLTLTYQQSSILASQPGQTGLLNIHSQLMMSYFSWIVILLILVIPILIMGFISGERKSHTFELLMTAPIHPYQIIVGKFFAGWGLGLLLLACAFFFPMVLSFYVDMDVMAMLSSFLGFSLLVAVYVSMSLFASSLTHSPMVAVGLGFLLNLSLFLIAGFSWDATSALIADLLQQVDVMTKVNYLFMGEFHLSSIFGLFSVVVIFLFLSERMIQAERWQ
ncbi:MAG: hypothetical protein CL677_06260 [Bdellovibrionaceae bacterium]|nr:hypothetical protein [Pseudobdellovibrionaceae bacterium]|tara:strand:- start:21429 stop:22196 length:768 start_codon:yes stop_codon:yes gene_type:complete